MTKRNFLSNLCRTAVTALRRCATRFPVALAFALTLTAYLIWLTATRYDTDDQLRITLGYYLSVGTFLSLSLHLWAEEVRRRSLRLGVQLAAHLLFLAYALYLYCHTSGPQSVDLAIGNASLALAVVLSVFFLPFFRERDDIASWNFTQTSLGLMALSVVVGGVMSAGLSLLVVSLHQLFGLHINEDCYLYILIVCGLLLPLLLFLGQLPEGEHKHDRRPEPTVFVQGVIRYLFLPLAGLYLAVLYVYAGTILVRWELPDGWVSWLVTALMAGCIVIETGLYPSRVRYARPVDQRIAIGLPLLALPLLVLMSVGIGRRFMDYGITLNRLYLATLNIWFYAVCIGLIAGRARRIGWIPASFALVFLLTSALPVNYAGLTRRVLRNQVKATLVQSGYDHLPIDRDTYEKWLSTLSSEDRQSVNSKLLYLNDLYDEASTNDLVNASQVFRDIALQEEGKGIESMYYNPPSGQTDELPQGYKYITFVKYSHDCPLTSTLSVPVSPAADTLLIPLDSLRRWKYTRQVHFLTTQQGNPFLPTYAYLGIDRNATQISAIIHGYLFHNNP